MRSNETSKQMKEDARYPGVLIHESSYVDEGCSIGKGSKIWHFTHVISGAHIGENTVLGQNVNVGSHAIIGNGVKIQNNVSLYDQVVLEDDVFCGPSCVFTNVFNPRSFISRKDEYRTTIIRTGASIGANTTIICGITIGRYAFVGAGSVVTRDIPDYGFVYGNPARLKGWFCCCGIKLQNLSCSACGRSYRIIDEHVGLVEHSLP